MCRWARKSVKTIPDYNCNFNIRYTPNVCHPTRFDCDACVLWLRHENIGYVASEFNSQHTIHFETMCKRHFLYVTIIRHPMSRIESHLNMHDKTPSFALNEIRDNVWAFNGLSPTGSAFFSNLYTRELGIKGTQAYSQKTLNNHTFLDAQKTLQAFDIIVKLEDIETAESIHKFEALKFTSPFPFANSKQYEHTNFQSVFWKALESYNTYDMKLYNDSYTASPSSRIHADSSLPPPSRSPPPPSLSPSMRSPPPPSSPPMRSPPPPNSLPMRSPPTSPPTLPTQHKQYLQSTADYVLLSLLQVSMFAMGTIYIRYRKLRKAYDKIDNIP